MGRPYSTCRIFSSPRRDGWPLPDPSRPSRPSGLEIALQDRHRCSSFGSNESRIIFDTAPRSYVRNANNDSKDFLLSTDGMGFWRYGVGPPPVASFCMSVHPLGAQNRMRRRVASGRWLNHPIHWRSVHKAHDVQRISDTCRVCVAVGSRVQSVASCECWRLEQRQPTTKSITADDHLMEPPRIMCIMIGLYHPPGRLNGHTSAWEIC